MSTKQHTLEPSIIDLFGGTIKRPLLCIPVIQSKIWGGRRLYQILEKGDGNSHCVGESWELSDNNTAQSQIGTSDGPMVNFRHFYEIFRKDILGSQSGVLSERFPLLLKFIDAQDNLSVQVHPRENSRLGDAKTEAWYVVDAPAGAEIIVGLSSQEPSSYILEKLKTSEAIDVLNKVQVKNGDILYIPGGTVHSITKGLLVFEIQQNSDTTFRMYDWDRTDAFGKSRELHLEEASQCIDFSVHQNHKIRPFSIRQPSHTIHHLVACPWFYLEKWTDFRGDIQWNLNNRFRIFTCLSGETRIVAGEFSEALKKGTTALVPAVCEDVVITQSTDDLSLLVSGIPDIKQDIVNPLLSAGYPKSSIQKLGGKEGLKW